VDVLGGFDFDHRQASIPPRGQQIENASFTRGELRSLSINGPPKKRGVDPFHIRAYLRFQPRLGIARIQQILAIRGPCVTHPRQTSANASISPIRLWVAKRFRSRPNIRLPPAARELQSANGQADGAIRLVAPLHAVDRRQPLHPFD